MRYSVTPEQRWQRADEFREKARRELQEASQLSSRGAGVDASALYTMALADAVSATRELLHGFVSYASGEHYEDKPDLPVLVRESESLGLGLEGLARFILQQSTTRNVRIHENPEQRVDYGYASWAITTSEQVRTRVARAIEGKAPAPVVVTPADQRPTLPPSGLAPIPPGEDVGPDAAPNTLKAQIAQFLPFVSRMTWRSTAAAAILLVTGIAVGLLVGTPVIGSPLALHAPGRSVSPAAATATALAAQGPFVFEGSLLITTPVCHAHEASLQIHNADSNPVRVNVASPDSRSARFATDPHASGQTTLETDVPANGMIAVYAVSTPPSGVYHIDVLSSAGAVQLAAATC